MVQVQEGRLRALEQDALALSKRIMDETNGVANHWRDAWSEFIKVALGKFVDLDRGTVVDLREN